MFSIWWKVHAKVPERVGALKASPATLEMGTSAPFLELKWTSEIAMMVVRFLERA